MKQVVIVESDNLRVLSAIAFKMGATRSIFTAILEEIIQTRANITFRYAINHLLNIEEEEWRLRYILGESTPNSRLIDDISNELQTYQAAWDMVAEVCNALHTHYNEDDYHMLSLIAIDDVSIGIVLESNKNG